MNEANELLSAIKIMTDKAINKTTAIYRGVVQSVNSTNKTCVVKIANVNNTVHYNGSVPTVNSAYWVFIPQGDMSLGFIITQGGSGSIVIDTNTSTTLNGITKGNGSKMGVAVAGTDYQTPLTAGVDYATPSSVSAKQDKITASGMLKGDGSGGVSAATAGTDYTTPSNVQDYINRTNAVDVANTNYTTYMARGVALNSSDTTPSVNGTISWTYE